MGKLNDQYLPQYISVCVSKYDKREVMGKLLGHKLLQTKDGHVLPYVTDHKQAFNLLSDKLTSRLIERFFHPNRINYYTTSSIGFHTSNGRFFGNIKQVNDAFRIGHVDPINVFEPLIWLEDNITRSGR